MILSHEIELPFTCGSPQFQHWMDLAERWAIRSICSIADSRWILTRIVELHHGDSRSISEYPTAYS